MTVDLHKAVVGDKIVFEDHNVASIVEIDTTKNCGSQLTHCITYRLGDGQKSNSSWTRDGYYWSSKTSCARNIVKVIFKSKPIEESPVDLNKIEVGDFVVMSATDIRKVIAHEIVTSSTPFLLHLEKATQELSNLSFTWDGFFYASRENADLNIKKIIKADKTKPLYSELTDDESNIIIAGLSQLLVDGKVSANQVRVIITKLASN